MQSQTQTRGASEPRGKLSPAPLRLRLRLLAGFLLTILLSHPAGVAAPDGSHDDGAESSHTGSVGSSPGPLVEGDGSSVAQASIRLSPEQRQMIGVTSATVEQTPLKKTI